MKTPANPSVTNASVGTGNRVDDMEPPDGDARFLPLTGKNFRFRCHRDIACFNRCCAALRLILTPYDILRLKRRLSLPSDRFLDRYTTTVTDLDNRFPRVRLRMDDNAGKTCPFVTPGGCAVYEDRPGACRIYPLGRASASSPGREDANEKFFVVKESHCMGFQEDREWTLKEWLEHEGAAEYNAMNDRWLNIITSSKGLGKGDLIRKHQMFFMASYNLDRFRAFLFGSRFFDRFDVTPERKKQLQDDDVELMKFAIEWLRFSLFGEKTMGLIG